MDYKEFKLAAIVAIDIPELAYRGKDTAGALEAWRSTITGAVESQGGVISKSVGDTFILSFANCQDALKCALRIRETGPRPPAPLVRMGIHLGEVYFFENDILGDAVNIAHSLRSSAAPGGICISGEVLGLVKDKLPLRANPIPEPRRGSLPRGIEGYELVEQAKPSQASMDEIRSAIMDQIRAQGRRLSVEEARTQFGHYGVEATEVIAALAESGILVGRGKSERTGGENFTPPFPPNIPRPPRYVPSGDIGKSIESAIHSIVSEIERAVDSTPSHPNRSGSGFHISIDENTFKESKEHLRSVGREIKRQIRDSNRSRGRRGSAPQDIEPYSAFRKYRNDLVVKADKRTKGITAGIVTYFVINAGLWFTNFRFAQQFPWAIFVSLFWGAGLVDSIITAIRSSRQAKEADALPDLDESQTQELKNINKERDSIGKHFASTLSVPAILFTINMLTNRADPWFIIPSAILAGTFVIHALTYLSSMPGRLKRFFKSIGIEGGHRGLEAARVRRASESTDLGNYASAYRDAEDAAADVLRSMSTTDRKAAGEMKPQLDGYLKQVLLLAKTANELDSIIGEIPMEALRKDKAELLGKSKSAPEAMRAEYASSIGEIEKQEESFKGLVEQKEVISLRLQSSINQLQQLKMDVARAKAADTETGASGAESAISSLRVRSQELSRYIDDLREGHLETLKDPFQELEEKFGTGAGAPESLPEK